MGVRYQFPPPERRRAALGPLSSGQVAFVAAATVLVVIGVTRPGASAPHVMLALMLLGMVAAAVLVPVRGRFVTEWAPVLASYAWARLRGRADTRSPAPGSSAPARWLAAPAGIGPVQLLAHPTQDGEIGVAVDRVAGRYTGVLEVAGPSFLLEDTSTKEQHLAGWGVLLDRLAQPTSNLARLQWLLRSMPDHPGTLRDYLRHARRDDLDQSAELLRSYLELVDACSAAATRHQTLLVAQVAAGGSAAAIRQAGGGDEGACTVLASTLRAVADGLADIGVAATHILDRRQYQGVLRVAYDPAAQVDLDLLDRLTPQRGWGSEAPWPLATEERWGYYRTADRAWHRCFNLVLPAAAALPADWFAPMPLADTGVCRTISMTLKTVPRQQANRQAGRALTRLRAEELRRQRMGQLQRAEDDRHEDAALQRMQELVEGHAELVYAVTVAVTAPDPATLELACRSVDHVAGLALCELRQLDGQQAQGFSWTLPLARGLD